MENVTCVLPTKHCHHGSGSERLWLLWIEWKILIQYIVNRVKHSDSLLWIEWNILIQYIVNRVKHSDTVLWIEWNILLWKEWSFIFVMNCVWIVRQLTGPWKRTHCSGPILLTSVAEFSDSTVDSLLDFNCCVFASSTDPWIWICIYIEWSNSLLYIYVC